MFVSKDRSQIGRGIELGQNWILRKDCQATRLLHSVISICQPQAESGSKKVTSSLPRCSFYQCGWESYPAMLHGGVELRPQWDNLSIRERREPNQFLILSMLPHGYPRFYQALREKTDFHHHTRHWSKWILDTEHRLLNLEYCNIQRPTCSYTVYVMGLRFKTVQRL